MAGLNGQYQTSERPEPEQFESVKNHPNFVASSSLSCEHKYLYFRCNKPPFDDVRGRLAAVHAIDRDQILELLGESA
ncbi:ABC transporter substrate-binding protein [Paracoccus suum]|uniref:ABC transporter substrate-binding protein n=1 Tax=Paracoccus suum TaxID=2259340 RepID=UPI0018EFD05F|nr:ABC transporter substrate-binding protein [Paracoccus suum]